MNRYLARVAALAVLLISAVMILFGAFNERPDLFVGFPLFVSGLICYVAFSGSVAEPLTEEQAHRLTHAAA